MGSEAAFEATFSGQEFLVTNLLDNPVTPTVHVKGRTLETEAGVRFSEGLALNGNTLAQKLLTGSILTLQPNGVGMWRYDAGFSPFEKGRTLAESANPQEYEKYRWDTCGGKAAAFTHSSIGLRMLRLRKGVPVCYPILFGDEIIIQELRVIMDWRRIESCGALRLWLSRDAAGEDVVTEYVVTKEGVTPECKSAEINHPVAMPGQMPQAVLRGRDFRFRDIGASQVWLHLSVEKDWVLIGSLNMTAWLDSSAVTLPQLEPGENKLVFTDDADSSHSAQWLLTWPDVVEQEHVLSSFEDGLDGWTAGEHASLEHSQGAPGGASRGNGYLAVNLTPPGDGREAIVSLSSLSETDWREYDRMEFSLNLPERPSGRLRIGFYSRPEGYNCLAWVSGTGNSWKRYSVDISKLGRSNVRWLRIGTYGPRWSGEKACRLFIDDIRLVRRVSDHEGEEPVKSQVLKGHTAEQLKELKENFDRWLKERPSEAGFPASVNATAAEDCFPMGVWGLGNKPRQFGEILGFEDPWDGFRAILHDLRANNMNAIAGSGHPFYQDDGRYFEILEEAGMKTWLYGPKYFHDQGSPEKNKDWFESAIVPTARKLAPFGAGQKSLLAWCFNEEIVTRMVPDNRQYYDLMREIAPGQSIVLLHNHIGPQKKQAECFPETRVMAWDRYPFRSGWANPLATWAASIDEHIKTARSINANLWVIMQSYSNGSYTPGGNFVHSRHISHPLQMKAQAWVAVGRGATGLFVYFYDPCRIRPEGSAGEYTILKTETGEDTPAYAAWAEALAEITPYTELLLKLQRVEENVAQSDDKRVWVTTFRARPGIELPDTYLIAVNADWESSRSFSINSDTPGVIYDVSDNQKLGDTGEATFTLPPAGGRIMRLVTE